MWNFRAEDRGGLWIEDRLGRGISIIRAVLTEGHTDRIPVDRSIRSETLDCQASFGYIVYHSLYSLDFDACFLALTKLQYAGQIIHDHCWCSLRRNFNPATWPRSS